MRSMRFGKRITKRRQSGQAMIETVLVLWFLMLPVLLNALNMAYFFLAVLNIQSASHKSNLYAIMGSATPAAQLLPPSTTSSTCTNCTVSYMAYQDLLSTALAGTNAAVRVCRSGACDPVVGTTPSGYAFPTMSDVDPETNPASKKPAFALSRIDIAYQLNPLIPGRIFNLGLSGFPRCGGKSQSCCNTDGRCVLHRFAEMRVMD